MVKMMRRSAERKLLFRRRKDGQAALEYMIVAAMLLGVVAIMAVLLYTLRENGGRVLDLVGSDWP